MAVNRKAIAGAAAGVTALVSSLLTQFEGERHTAYQDSVGVWTICMGETKGVTPGMKKTHAECMDMLNKRIPDYLGPVDKLMPGLPDNRRAAYTVFAYNLGVGKLTLRTKDAHKREIVGTSIVDLEKAGNWRAACGRINQFVYAGGKKLNGLVKRRAEESALCLG